MTPRTRLTILVALAAVLAATPAVAQTQVDFDACNQIAAAKAGASASPGSAGSVSSSSPGTSVGGSVMTAPGSSDVNRMPNVSGRISGSAGSPGSDAGTATMPTPSAPASPSASGPTASATTSIGPAGIARAGQSDPVYQQAYRDCLKSRGF
jgi:hypothetical protein